MKKLNAKRIFKTINKVSTVLGTLIVIGYILMMLIGLVGIILFVNFIERLGM